MKAGLPEPVERVSAFLRAAGAEARIEQFDAGTPTAQDAADAVGCELAQIVKSVVFDCGSRAVVALVPGDRRADRRKVAEAGGCSRASVAGPERVEEVTGFAPGAVAPFPLPNVDRILLERTLLPHAVVWVGAGSENHLAALSPTELLRLTRAEPADLIDDPC